MKNKRWMGLLAAGFLALGLTACQLAEKGAASPQNQKAEDTLIGAIVTVGTEEVPTSNMEGYLTDHPEVILGKKDIDLDDLSDYDNRIYGSKEVKRFFDESEQAYVEREVAAFPQMKGVFFSFETVYQQEDGAEVVSVETAANEGLWNAFTGAGTMHTMDMTEGADTSFTMEGSVYYRHQERVPVFTVNPVYRTPTGEVYTTKGISLTQEFPPEQGAFLSSFYSDTHTIEQNGTTAEEKISLKVNIGMKHPPQKIILVQMNAQDRELSRQEYQPGQLPNTITPHRNTAYLLVESYYLDNQGNQGIDRELVTPSDSKLSTPYLLDNDFLAPQVTKVLWQKGSQ